jgi:hypothetical protein
LAKWSGRLPIWAEIGGQTGGKRVVFWFFLFCLKNFEQLDGGMASDELKI